jgi:hypothetical protein
MDRGGGGQVTRLNVSFIGSLCSLGWKSHIPGYIWEMFRPGHECQQARKLIAIKGRQRTNSILLAREAELL